jgi:hypothetical protein
MRLAICGTTRDLAIPLLLILLLTGPATGDPLHQDGETGSDEPLDITWSTPGPGGPPELAAWSLGFRRELLPVLSAWARFRRRLQGELPARFDPQCVGLVDSLDRLDRAVILPVPDLLIDLYVRRLMLHLDAAALACERHELYNVVYRFDEAGSALGDIRSLMAQRGLGP